MKENIKANTWLPIFPGFYETIFDEDFESELDYVKDEIIKDKEDYEDEKKLIEEYFYGCDAYIKLWKEYKQDVIEQVTKLVEKWLIENGFVKSVKLEGLQSPREYNFMNDSISIAVEFDGDAEKVQQYIKEHMEAWKTYLKEHYTSCPGFWSSYDNDPESNDWKLPNCLDNGHKSGAVLDFIMRNEGLDEMWMYEDYENRVSINDEELRKEIKNVHYNKD